MPIYVYAPVENSDQDLNECCYFETLQSMSEAPLTACPECGKAIHRVPAGFALTHKNKPVPKDAKLFSSPVADTPASRVAKSTMRHVCSLGCRH